MKRPAELMDWDRSPDAQKVYRAIASSRTEQFPPTPAKPKRDTAGIAFACLFTMGALVGFIGLATIIRWIAEAVR
jgi:hypothetical protein